jgi:hypothetical protein
MTGARHGLAVYVVGDDRLLFERSVGDWSGGVYWRNAGVPNSEPAVRHAAITGDLDPGQRAWIRRDGLGCLGDATRVHLHFTQPEELVQNTFIESVNGKFRDECLNEPWFLTRQEAQLVIEAWRREYNEERTHSAIGHLTPTEFINHHHNQPQTAQESTLLAVVY